MKKIFVLSVLSAACAASFAQSAPTVTLYGIVDVGVQRVSGYAKGTDTALVSGIMEGSRVGLRGSEDLGGGYRALFTLENRTEVNNGSLSNRPPSGAQVPDRFSQGQYLIPGFSSLPAAQQAGFQQAITGVASSVGSTLGVNVPTLAKPSNPAFWDRQAYVGLVTPFGAIIAGRQYTPAYEMSATFDTMGTQSSLAAGQAASIPSSIDIRVDNALQYRIVKGPISAGLMYALGGVTSNSSARRMAGGFAMYRDDRYSAGIGYNQRNNEQGAKSLQSLVVGATAMVGPGKLSGMYVQFKDNNPTDLSGIAVQLTPLTGAAVAGLIQGAFINALKQDGRLFNIGYKLETGPNTFYVAYTGVNDRTAYNADVASYGVAYTYALSKRTDLNAIATHFNNKNLSQAAPGQAGFLGGVTASAGTDSNSVAFGIRHRF